jgi:hypothetical protein
VAFLIGDALRVQTLEDKDLKVTMFRAPMGRLCICCSLVIFLLVGSTLIAQQTRPAKTSPSKIKAEIKALGAKSNNEVQVILVDGTVLTGRIHQPGSKDFILITSERAQAYAYADVAQVKKTRPPANAKLDKVQ